MKRLCIKQVQSVQSVAFAISLLCLLAGLLHAAENPFAQVAQANYEGRYAGPNVTLQLKPEAGKWTGSVNLKGSRYTLQGETRDGKLEGTFGAGDQTWPFSAKCDGENLNFTTGESTTPLTKVKLPKLVGLYESSHVKLEFLNQDGGLNGTIAYNGKQFRFSAAETGGDVVGVFKSGEAAFPFKIVKEGSQIEFQTEGFAEAIKPPYDPNDYRAKAEQGDAAAQCNLGYCYDIGSGVAKDPVEAVKWYRKAAEQGDDTAQTNLGIEYKIGIGVNKDLTEAMNWFRKAAEHGNAYAQENLGDFYIGSGIDTGLMEAAKWYRKAADQGNTNVYFRLGDCFKLAKGADKNMAEAVKWYRKAADQGDSRATLELGRDYLSGIGMDRDEAEGIKWYRKAAEQGSVSAMNELGHAYLDGINVAQDKTEGVKWYRKAAELGIIRSQLILAFYYEFGGDAAKDLPEAFSWYRKAGENKFPSAFAKYNLGRCYRLGIGVETNLVEAARWEQLATNKVAPVIFINLSWLLATHKEAGLRDGKKAVELATIACNMSGWTNAGFLHTLSAAYAEAGDFGQATNYCQKEIDLPKNRITIQSVSNALERLKLYQDHKPYHQAEW